MRELHYLIAGQLLVATLMGLGALCLFVWAAAAGLLRDVYRTMTTGLDGTPMPSFADSMKDDERWAISYYVLSLSAFRDPLTGTPLALDDRARARLDATEPGRFASPGLALDPAAAVEGPKALVRFHKGMLGEGR